MSEQCVIEEFYELLHLLAYNTRSKRFARLLQLFVQLVELDAVSSFEIQQRLPLLINKLTNENGYEEWQDEEHILDTLLNLTCFRNEFLLKPQTKTLTEYHIDKAVTKEIEDLDKRSALFLKRNYFPNIFV